MLATLAPVQQGRVVVYRRCDGLYVVCTGNVMYVCVNVCRQPATVSWNTSKSSGEPTPPTRRSVSHTLLGAVSVLHWGRMLCPDPSTSQTYRRKQWLVVLNPMLPGNPQLPHPSASQKNTVFSEQFSIINDTGRRSAAQHKVQHVNGFVRHSSSSAHSDPKKYWATMYKNSPQSSSCTIEIPTVEEVINEAHDENSMCAAGVDDVQQQLHQERENQQQHQLSLIHI